MSPESGPRRSERSRQAILAAARELITEVGYGKLSIEGIAARAGVGKQTIYRWWPSKGAVVFDSLLALSQDSAGDIELPDTGDIRADLKAVLRATVEEFTDDGFQAPIRALYTEIMNDPQLATAYRERMDAPVREAKLRRLRSAQLAGELAEDVDLDLLLDMLHAPLTQRWLLRSGGLDATFADALVDATLRAFAPT